MSTMADTAPSILTIPKHIERTPSLVACEQNVGDYAIHHTLSKGSFGRVKLGHHIISGEPVAIKIVQKKMVNMSAIKHEADVWLGLRHNHVARLLEVQETSRWLFMVMECAPRGELFNHIVARGYINESDARRYFVQIVSALIYVHSKGIVHRDLKPENLLLDEYRNIKLIDFGFATKAGRDELLDLFCGSSAYASPEIVMEEEYNGYQSDIWSLGVVLYVMVVGVLPFDGDDEEERISAVIDGRFELPVELSADVCDLLKNLMVKNPARRMPLEDILLHPWLCPAANAPIMRTSAPIVLPSPAVGMHPELTAEGHKVYNRPLTPAEKMYVCLVGSADGAIEGMCITPGLRKILLEHGFTDDDVKDGLHEGRQHMVSVVFLMTSVSLRKFREKASRELNTSFRSGKYPFDAAWKIAEQRRDALEAPVSDGKSERPSPTRLPVPTGVTQLRIVSRTAQSMVDLDPEGRLPGMVMLPGVTAGSRGARCRPPPPMLSPVVGCVRAMPASAGGPARRHVTPGVPPLPVVGERSSTTDVCARTFPSLKPILPSNGDVQRSRLVPGPVPPRKGGKATVRTRTTSSNWSVYNPVELEESTLGFEDVYNVPQTGTTDGPVRRGRNAAAVLELEQLQLGPGGVIMDARSPGRSVIGLPSQSEDPIQCGMPKSAAPCMRSEFDIGLDGASGERSLEAAVSRDSFIPPKDPRAIRVVEDDVNLSSSTTTLKTSEETINAVRRAAEKSNVEVRRLAHYVFEGRLRRSNSKNQSELDYRCRIEIVYVQRLRMNAVLLHREAGDIWLHKHAMDNLRGQLEVWL